MTRADRRTLVIMPTYNEATTIPVALERVLAEAPDLNVLVVDDNSPDGTGAIVDRIAADDDRIAALHRSGKLGLGTAYVAGFRWALERGYDVIVEMDADGSHRPEDLPKILRVLDAYPDAAVVLGSRWISGGKTENWAKSRQLISRFGNAYVHLALGLPVGDATGGFRAYRAEKLAELELDDIASQGYCFQVDVLWRLHQRGELIVEAPITFVERRAGTSKMSGAIAREALVNITVWGTRHRARQLKRVVTGKN
ncbi:polyprenol monophosphomannose synthase [Rarobacter faecitabidus]|uniref:Dolichol-phosphate mannosyltransferase n=1 Tax=Rarobacter faecitabidus TaxID=13243 RepID=A0A542ZVK7_RARFA|nr:polyprenol monophosphomannose synthase [Rarobacter faecitabidus]TQL64395.1 dolichol-phosphate mannosyltransferase [Rarobacter faecitabidus]